MYSVFLTALREAAIQILNSIGALTLVYMFRYGSALVVSSRAFAAAEPA